MFTKGILHMAFGKNVSRVRGDCASVDFSIRYRVTFAIIFFASFFQTTQPFSFCSEPSIDLVLRKYEDGLQTIHSVRIRSSSGTHGSSSQSSDFAFQDGASLERRVVKDSDGTTRTMERLGEQHTLLMAVELLDTNNGKAHTVQADAVPFDIQDNQNIILAFSCLFGKLPFRLFEEDSVVGVLRKYVSSMSEVDVEGKKMFEMTGDSGGVRVSAKFMLNDYATLYSFRYDVDEKVAESGNCFSFDYRPADFVQYGDLLMPKIYLFDYSILAIDYEYDANMRLIPGGLTKNSANFRENIESIEINPSIPQSHFSISLDIPNGTTVVDQRAPHIEHIWYDGRIVPKTDEVMLAIARGGHKFMPGPDEPRFWLLMLSFLLIALGLGKMIYNIIHKKEAGT